MEKLKKSLLTARAMLYKWKANSDGRAPVRLCVTYKRDRRYYTIGHGGEKLFMDAVTWNQVEDEKSKGGRSQRIVDIRATIKAAESRAAHAFETVTRNNHQFSWDRFESEFLLGETSAGFLALFRRNIAALREDDDRIGSATAYNTAYHAFFAFRRGKELSPHDITPKLLREYEKFLERGGHQEQRKKDGQRNLKIRGINKTSIGIYMRAMKVVYNLAADEDKTLLETYPFARRQNERAKYKIRTGSGHKGDALTIEQLQKLYSLFVESSEHEEARLLWLLSFYCQGMNMRDIALLQYKDIGDGVIKYVRHKTKETESIEELIEVPVNDDILAIISKIGNPDKRPTSYVFTIIPNGLANPGPRRSSRVITPGERIVQIIQQKTKMVNKRLRQLCEDENAKLKDGEGVRLPIITTYWARHTYSNLLRKGGAPDELIQQALGHADLKTTRHYLRRFDNEEMKKANEGITRLLKPVSDTNE